MNNSVGRSLMTMRCKPALQRNGNVPDCVERMQSSQTTTAPEGLQEQRSKAWVGSHSRLPAFNPSTPTRRVAASRCAL